MTKRKKLRRAGARWRALVHVPHERTYSIAHSPSFGGHAADSDSYKNITLPDTEFDELVIGSWIHLEQMNNSTWWMNIGGVTVWVKADRDGNPLSVSVHGPGDYAGQEPGCEYHLDWSGDDVIKPLVMPPVSTPDTPMSTHKER